MPSFKYRAVDAEGHPVEGTMEEQSAAKVTVLLQERGLQVSSVEPTEKQRGFTRRKRKLTLEDLHLFNEQLLAITKSGLPLAPAIKALARDAGNRRIIPLLENIRRDLERGAPLEEALSQHPETFSPVYTSIVKAGERSGNLSGVFSHLCAYSARSLEVRNSLQEAVAYPVLVLIACVCVLGFLVLKIVPDFAAIFSEFGAALPYITRFWLDVSDFLRDNFLATCVGLSVIVVFFTYVMKSIFRTESGGYTLDRLKMRLGVFGRLYTFSSMGRFSRSLGLLLSSEVPMEESLELAAAASGNAVLRRAVAHASQGVQRGERLSDALEDTGEFSHTFCWLLATAEERGEVDTALLDMADTFERNISRLNTMVIRLTVPVTVIVTGAIVASVVIALYLPVFTLADVMSGS
jgi:type IV pilus assembly protein PilC